MNNSLYGNYRTRTFCDIWNSETSFETDFKESPFAGSISDENINLLYYLLYASYGNSHIGSSDENQFKYKVYSVIFKYGPTWESRIKIQKELRDLMGTEDLFLGSTEIYNHSNNPSIKPTTQTLDELTTIDDQNVTKRKRNKLDAYSLLYQMLVSDVTQEFINRFKPLFLQIVEPQLPLWYITDENDEETLCV